MFQFRLVFKSYSLGRVRHGLDYRRKRSKAGTLKSAGEMYDEPLPLHPTNFASSYEVTPVLAASLTAFYQSQFRVADTSFARFEPCTVIVRHSQVLSRHHGIISYWTLLIRGMLVPLWLRHVQLWLCTFSASTNVCAVSSCPVFVATPGCLSPPQDVSASALCWEVPSSKSVLFFL